MYLFFLILLPLLIILVFLGYYRKKKKIQLVKNMCTEEKISLLNELVAPYGYYYIYDQDIFTTHIDAWQRDFGYSALYDKLSVHLNMVFDCLPVYFDYHGRTWLMEFWKGQYGINTGCEMGLYYTDHILSPDQRNSTLFQSVEDSDMVKMSFTLYKENETLARLNRVHWWLSAFHVGCFSRPKELSMHITVTFPNPEMAKLFADGLRAAGISPLNVYRHRNSVSFPFEHTASHPGFLRRMRIRLAQFTNRLGCRIYQFVTRPFSLSLDKILYLYFHLPFVFRKVLRIRKIKKSKRSPKTKQ